MINSKALRAAKRRKWMKMEFKRSGDKLVASFDPIWLSMLIAEGASAELSFALASP